MFDLKKYFEKVIRTHNIEKERDEKKNEISKK